MEYLGSRNLFTSHFVMGCEESDLNFTLTETDEIKELHSWLEFKDADWGMSSYRSKYTLFVDFLHIIELSSVQQIINDLKLIYQREFPFSEKEDFIKDVFEYTLNELEDFIKTDFVPYGSLGKNYKYDFYFNCYRETHEYLDYAIDSSKTLQYYKQYYKKVIQLILDHDYSQNNAKSEDENDRFHFTNKLDHVQESEVYDYFHSSLVLTKYLDKDSLEAFLILAFDKRTNPEEKFVFKGSPGKNRIIPIFYKYFNEIAHPERGRKIDYVNLLGNYFKGYNSASLMTNFSK